MPPGVAAGSRIAATDYFNFDTWGPFWTANSPKPPSGCVLPRPIMPAPAQNNLISASIRKTPQGGSEAMVAIDTGQVDARTPLQVMRSFAARCGTYSTEHLGGQIVMMPRAETLSVVGADEALLVTLDFHDDGGAGRNHSRWVRAYAVVKKVLVVVMVPMVTSAQAAAGMATERELATALLKGQVAKVLRLVG